MDTGAQVFVNCIEINPKPSDLFFIVRTLWQQAQLVVINEFHDDLVGSSLRLSASNNLEVHQAEVRLLAGIPEIRSSLPLTNLCGKKVIVIYEIRSLDFLRYIISEYQPDLIICADEVQLVQEGLLELDYEKVSILNHLPDRFSATKFTLFEREHSSDVFIGDIALLSRHLNKIALSKVKLFDVDELCTAFGFWPLEKHKVWSWIWTGPINSSVFFIPVGSCSKKKLTLFFFAAKVPIDIDNIAICIDGRRVISRYYPDLMKIECIYDPPYGAFCSRIEIRVMCPVVVEDHSRRIGVALHKVRLEEVE